MFIMAPVKFSPIVDVGAGVATSDPHGSTEQTPSQICYKSVSRGMSSPDVVLHVQDFDNAYDWLEKCTLIVYFMGRIPPKSILCDRVANA